MGRIEGDHIGRELLRLRRLEECNGPQNLGDHIGRGLLRLHRLEELMRPANAREDLPEA